MRIPLRCWRWADKETRRMASALHGGREWREDKLVAANCEWKGYVEANLEQNICKVFVSEDEHCVECLDGEQVLLLS